MRVSGGMVRGEYKAGGVRDIQGDCKVGVLNTYLVYLRYELLRGGLTEVVYQEELRWLEVCCRSESKPHADLFLKCWLGSIF